jgi:hypothetical protein
MEVLGAILLVELMIGVLVALGARRRHQTPAPQQRDVILADESMFVIAPVRSVEPVQIPRFRRTCGCKHIGCTM